MRSLVLAAVLLQSLFLVLTSAHAGDGVSCRSCKTWQCQDASVIRDVQRALADRGEKVKVDGSFGGMTQKALDNHARKSGVSDTQPRSTALLKSLFSEGEYERIRKRIYSAWVC